MLEARSVAVVGASAREGSFGREMLRQLLDVGRFDGQIFPVNPSYDELFDMPCLPSLDALPAPVDLALLGIRNAHLEEQLRSAVSAGVRSAVIFASCYEAARPGTPALADRLAAIAGGAGMAVCGGNCMGFLNLSGSLRACGFSQPAGLEPGPIAFITHSGSAFSAMLHNDRGLRFGLAVSSGIELVTTTDQYLRFALDRPEIRAVGLFIETVRRPEGFRAALDLASERDVPVVALKVGREPRAKELVVAHSGALAGEDGAYEALFDSYGVQRVRTLDEMADTLELLVAGRRAAPGGLASVHDSGGERAHLIDLAAEAGVRFAQPSEATVARLGAVLEEGLPAVNPLDAWGTGNDAESIFAGCMRALLEDPDTGAIALCVDLTTEVEPGTGYARVASEVFATTTKPVAVLSNLASAADRRDAAMLRRSGVPVLEGTATGLAAFGHLFSYRDHRARPPLEPPDPVPPELRRRWRTRSSSPDPWSEAEALRLLGEFGVPVVRAERAGSLEDALAAGARLGWPVVLKTASPTTPHKSDVGGVALGLADRAALAAAYTDLAARLGPAVTVEEAAPPGVEMALGVIRDEQFGPLVMVAAGGVLVETLGDRRFGLPPLDEPRARRLVEGLGARRLLDGVRGSPPADVGSLVRAMVRLSVVATELGDLVEAIDVNPLIVGPDGCVAVDALVVPHRAVEG